MMYHVYHIPGKKVGVTRDLKERVENQQGYGPGEYTVVYSTEDISVASSMERELQEAYGYKVDQTLYENLTINNKNEEEMNINVTEQTTTFACPLNKLKGQLMDNIGMQWETAHGKFTVTGQSVTWLLANARTSQFSNERCYIYNKAFAKYWETDPMRNVLPLTNEELHDATVEKLPMHCSDCGDHLFDCIRRWAEERGLYEKGDVKTQYIKLAEEFGETGKALLNNNKEEVIDGIGDMVVVLTNLAHLSGTTIEECIEAAYKEISNRKGKMVNGTFIKNS